MGKPGGGDLNDLNAVAMDELAEALAAHAWPG